MGYQDRTAVHSTDHRHGGMHNSSRTPAALR